MSYSDWFKNKSIWGKGGHLADHAQLNLSSKIYGPRMVTWGDSITAGSVGNLPATGSGLTALQDKSQQMQQQGISYGALAGVLAGNIVKYIHNAGYPGAKSDYILSRFATDVLPYTPDIVVLLAGTNDMSSTSGITLAQSIANIKACVTQIRSINALPILSTLPPKSPTANYGDVELTRQLQFNSWLRAYCSKYRLPLVDHFSALVDPRFATFQTTYTISFGGATSGNITFRVSDQIAGGVLQTWATGGTNVSITVNTQIPFNATAAAVQSALCNALAANGYLKQGFIVTGPAGGPYAVASSTGYPFDITFATNTFAGGTTATVTVGNHYTQDGTHPSNPGGIRAMANALVYVLKQQFQSTSYNHISTISDNNAGQYLLTYPVTDSTNLFRNGCFTGTGSGTNADYWVPNTAANTYTLVPPIASDNLVGNWLQVVPVTSFSYGIQVNTSVGFSAGDTIAFSGRIRISGIEASPQPMPWVANTNTVSVVAQTYGGVAGQFSPINAWQMNITDGWFYQELTVPVGTTSITFYLFLNGLGFTVQVGQWSAINLTTNGLLNI